MTSPAAPTMDRKQVVVIGLLVIGVLWGYDRYVFTPLFRAVVQVSQAVRAAKGQLREMEQAVVQEPQLHQQLLQLEGQVARLRAVIPTEEGVPAVIDQLTALAGQTGVKIQSITPQRLLVNLSEPVASKEPHARKDSPPIPAYTEIPIQLEALTGFHQLGAFLSRVEQGEQPMQLRSLRISENPKLLRRQVVKMTLAAYAMPSASNGKPAALNAARPPRSGK